MPTKKIPLCQWGEARYDPPPSAWTLRRWVREGQIYPPPEKVGKGYYVHPDARRISVDTGAAAALPGGSLVERLRAADAAHA